MIAQKSWLTWEGINIPIQKQDRGRTIKVFEVPIIKMSCRSLRNMCDSIALNLKKQLHNGLMNSAPPDGRSDDKVKKNLGVVFMVRLEVKYYLPGAISTMTQCSSCYPGVILLHSRADICLGSLRGGLRHVQNISPVTALMQPPFHSGQSPSLVDFAPLHFPPFLPTWLQVLVVSFCPAGPWIGSPCAAGAPLGLPGQALASSASWCSGTSRSCPTALSHSGFWVTEPTSVLFQPRTSPAIRICPASLFVRVLCPKASFKVSFSQTSPKQLVFQLCLPNCALCFPIPLGHNIPVLPLAPTEPFWPKPLFLQSPPGFDQATGKRCWREEWQKQRLELRICGVMLNSTQCFSCARTELNLPVRAQEQLWHRDVLQPIGHHPTEMCRVHCPEMGPSLSHWHYGQWLRALFRTDCKPGTPFLPWQPVLKPLSGPLTSHMALQHHDSFQPAWMQKNISRTDCPVAPWPSTCSQGHWITDTW